ncbi:MAG: PA2779 family protein [Burkholderiales bacterium]
MICRALIVSLLMLSFNSATAGMIGTDRATGVGSTQAERAHIGSLLARDDVSRQLQALGVDIKTAQDRVAMLTDDEARSLAGKLDSMPAGAGDSWWIAAVIVVAVLAWWYWGRR